MAKTIDTAIKQYTVIIETQDEVHSTTKDTYGLKAGGIVTALERLACFEQAFSAVNVTKSFYHRQRQDNKFYESVVKIAHDLQIGECMLPRYRKALH